VAKAVINPEADLPSRPGDVPLSLEQLAVLGIFASLKKAPSFNKFPGTYILRHYAAGDAICRQGETGGTAFYLLTPADVEALRKQTAVGEKQSTGQANEPLRRDCERILKQMRAAGAAGAVEGESPIQLATARLLLDKASQAAPRRSIWPWANKTSPGEASGQSTPAFIANDGPADIDYATKRAPMYAGEVFGEMSCLSRQPRSATVVAEAECLVLEFLRNILDQMRKDPECKKATEKKYRERVLENHLRQLSIFSLLSEEEFAEIRKQVELVEVPPGGVIWDEGDASDSLLVVRNGSVQVVQNFPWRVTPQMVTDWKALASALGGPDAKAGGIEKLRTSLPKPLQEKLAAVSGEIPEELRPEIVQSLDELAKTDVLLSAKEVQAEMATATFARETAGYPPKVKAWSGLQIRRGNRVLYHLLLPGAVAPAEPIGITKVLRYVSRGETLGEMGLVLKQARSATCVAYSHYELDREATAVELVRVPGTVVTEMAAKSPRMRAEMEKITAARHKSEPSVKDSSISALSQSRRAEELGLLQGQNLMLIDLDRCTRCGDCVEACIATHDDGYSRLFLDGPRYGKYLIPSSCRRCRDPVCMIGCPVGSIQQGSDGEIQIREWCIGCSQCAEQCPYDSIQMHALGIVPDGMFGWRWTQEIDPDDKKWNTLGYDDRTWQAGTTPFAWNLGMQMAARDASPDGYAGLATRRFYFRVKFRIDPQQNAQERKYQVFATAQGNGLSIYVNGEPLELSQDAPQKKRSQFMAIFPGEDCNLPEGKPSSNGVAATKPEKVLAGVGEQTPVAKPKKPSNCIELRSGDNVLAASVMAPSDFDATLLDIRLDALPPEAATVEEKLVTERAVVCDQCSSLSGDRHACVYACPHEAALRVDTWVNFPDGS
jgi:Fe-S-cluster-containing hydrogenase component 2/CRP-like cAMP-binding protein